MHHRHDIPTIERFQFGTVGIKLCHPCTFEIERIEQVTYSIFVELIRGKDFLDDTMCMVAAPLVDDVTRRIVIEVARLGLGIIIIVGFLYEWRLQFVAPMIVYIDVVGNLGSGLLIEYGDLAEHLVAELVDSICSKIAKAQHVVDFLLRLAGSTIIQHTHGIGDAQRRQHQILLVAGLTEKSEGEVVATLYQLLFFCGQTDVVAGIIYGLAHVLTDEKNGARRPLADDIEERVVGNKLCILRHAFICHLYDGGSCGFSAILVKFQVGFLAHQAYPTRFGIFLVITRVAEIHKAVPIGKGVLHAQRYHDFFQVLIRIGLYAWHEQIHHIILVFSSVPVCTVHGSHHIIKGFTVLWQE